MSTTTPVPITDEREKRAFVQRIADSPGFRSAPRLRDFLLFVTDVALSGRSSEISEQYIGREVFHRATDYDTANDNIVRVSARQLRIKLHEYADTEGNADPWVLDIPKGGYVPVFTRRQPAVVEAPPANRMSPRWRIAAVVCAAIALLATGAPGSMARSSAHPFATTSSAEPPAARFAATKRSTSWDTKVHAGAMAPPRC
ncbi:MAG: hypothetical protein SGI92_33615 [Bryobacteraceae bacterium]|nr:hypothetical protein [Bryobacteraceae bacterium]